MAQTFTRDELTLAFTWHLARQVTDADFDVTDGELSWMDRNFPMKNLWAADFVGENGAPTLRYEDALGEALVVLPDELRLDEKLALITMLFELTLADDEFHHTEGSVIVRAAQLLGVTNSELDAHLSSLDSVGEVDLD